MSTDKARAFTPEFFRQWAGAVALIAGFTGPIQAIYDVVQVGDVDLPTLVGWLALAVLGGLVWLVLRIRTRP